jgi:hypothetical protein
VRNLLDERTRGRLLARFKALDEGRPARWGRMTVGQMVCHCADQLRISLGDLPAKDVSTGLTRTVLRWMVLSGFPVPKGKVKTFAEIDQAAGWGTSAQGLALDLQHLETLTERFVEKAAAGGTFAPNPAFGALTSRQWGRLAYVHMAHHLKQFGA